MIPFNYLGPVFKIFASLIYPGKFKDELRDIARKFRENGAVLDIGSGTGILSTFIVKERRDLRMSLLDPAPGMLKYAPKFMAKVTGVAESLPFADDFFDAVLIGDALHHFNDPGRAMHEICRVIRSGGFLIIFEIDPGTGLGSVITRGEKLLGEPAHFYTPENLKELLPDHVFGHRICRFDWRYALIAQKEVR